MAMLSMLGDSTGARRPVTPERLQALQGLLADLRAAEPTPQSREALFRVARDVQWALLDRGSSDDAIALGEEMAQLADEAGDAQWRLRFGNDLGKAYAGSGDGHRPDSSLVAEVQFTKVLAGARDMGDRRAESAALNNLGIVFQMRGGVREALSLYRQALAIAREVRDRRSEGPVLANLGLAHASLGDVGQAIECYEQALAISREIGDYRGECSALGNLGVAYASLGDLRRAADLVQDALRLALAARDPLRTPQHASQLADVRRDRGDLAAAVALQGLALSRFSALGDPEAGRAARELARYRDRMGEEAFSAALAGAEDVVAGIFRELAGPEGEAMARPLQVTPDDVDAALAAGWGRATAPRRCSATPVANTHHVICPDQPHPASAKEALPCSSHCFFRTTMSRLLLRLL